MIVGFVISEGVSAITPDDAIAATILKERGTDVRAVIWDADEPPAGIDAFVIRSPWNYHLHAREFLAWIDRAAKLATVHNHPATIAWNAHKGYLLELQRSGIPVVPTVLCPKDSQCDLHELMRENGWERAVVKPAISASSFMTSIVGPAQTSGHAFEAHLHGRVFEDGQHLLDRILESRDALIQPFMPHILDRGERSLIFIDGAFSHAVQKTPFTDEPGKGHQVAAEDGEIKIGADALATLDRTPLYARVDLLRDPRERDRLMELELIDPELYFRFSAEAAHRFADALLRRI